MGNRAVIAFTAEPTTGIYLHWQGGPGSVLAFINAAKYRGARSPGSDTSYAFGALASTIGEFMHGDWRETRVKYPSCTELMSFGIGPIDTLDTDNYDNGVYWIGDDWKIVKREFSSNGPCNSRDQLPEGYEQESYDSVYKNLTESKPSLASE